MNWVCVDYYKFVLLLPFLLFNLLIEYSSFKGRVESSVL